MEDIIDIIASKSTLKVLWIRFGGACDRLWRVKTCIRSFGGEIQRQKDRLEYMGVSGRALFKWILKRFRKISFIDTHILRKGANLYFEHVMTDCSEICQRLLSPKGV